MIGSPDTVSIVNGEAGGNFAPSSTTQVPTQQNVGSKRAIEEQLASTDPGADSPAGFGGPAPNAVDMSDSPREPPDTTQDVIIHDEGSGSEDQHGQDPDISSEYEQPWTSNNYIQKATL